MSEIESGDPSVPASVPSSEARVESVDAYRGAVMITLACGGFGLHETAKRHLAANVGNRGLWETLEFQFEHVPWVGCTYWDLIQPSFMFLVGVAMAFSYAKRASRGDGFSKQFAHAIWRGLALVLLGVFLISNWSRSTDWSLVNVLTQIGLGYPFVFLLSRCAPRWQAVAAGLVLVGTWIAFVVYPGAGVDLESGAPAVGVPADWAREHLAGVDASWHKNANLGHALDVRLLNWFPQETPFEFNRGGYQTLNFVPSIATMLSGLLAGGLMLSGQTRTRKATWLFAAGLGGLALGWILGATGVCPIVKRIWTPSWAIFSSGWCLLMLGAFFVGVDVCGLKSIAFPLRVVGRNSLAIYAMGMLLKSWTANTMQIHLGQDVFKSFGELWEPTVRATAVGLVFWLVLWWMWRRRLFLRL